MIIAVDFDGTLCENKYPKIGEPNRKLIGIIKNFQKRGDKFILYTCREGLLLDEAVAWCKQMQLNFDAVNENLPEHIKAYGNDCRKIFADEYWDDKAYHTEYQKKD